MQISCWISAHRFHSYYNPVQLVWFWSWSLGAPFVFWDSGHLCELIFSYVLQDYSGLSWASGGLLWSVNKSDLAQEDSKVPSCMCHCFRHFIKRISWGGKFGLRDITRLHLYSGERDSRLQHCPYCTAEGPGWLPWTLHFLKYVLSFHDKKLSPLLHSTFLSLFQLNDPCFQNSSTTCYTYPRLE